GKRLPVLSFLAWLVLVYPLGWLVAHFTRLAEGLTGVLMLGLAASTLVTLVGALITRAVLASVARSQVRETAEPLGESLAEAGRLFPAWDDPAWQDWKPGAAPPPVLRFGDYRVSKGDIPDAVPAGERLGGTAVDDFTLPALAAFPDSYSMLFRAHDAGRDRA